MRLLSSAIITLTLSLPWQAPTAMPLGAVTVNGVKHFTHDDVVKLSGLEIGQAASARALDDAASHLAGTGLFKSVNYRFTVSGGTLNAVLDVEEEPWTLPAVFDNFVWFTDAELMAAVRDSLPKFDGTLPANDAAADYVAKSLQRLLDARHIQGRVSGEGRVNIKSGARQQLFTVTGAASSLKMCAIRIPAALVVPEAELAKAVESVIGTNYSRAFSDGLASGTLRQEYRRRGFWAAELKYESSALDHGCAGVTVTFAANEGVAYTFDRAEWSGAAALKTTDLDRALGLKAGDVADVARLDAGMRAIHATYDRLGYVQQEATYTPVLDEARRHVMFRIAVIERRQFHMGTLTFPDLPAPDAERMIKKWRIAAGQVYDGSYLAEYTLKEIEPLKMGGALPRTLRAETSVDRATSLVHVRFVVPR